MLLSDPLDRPPPLSAGGVDSSVAHWHEPLRRLAPYLVPSDRILAEVCLVRGLSCREASPVLSMCAGSVSRRTRRIRHVLRSDEVRSILDHGVALGEETRHLALRRLVGGEHLVSLAPQFGVSVRTARRMLQRARIWVRARDVGARAAARQLLEDRPDLDTDESFEPHTKSPARSVVRIDDLAYGATRHV